jgi:hypothetical protein
MKQIRKKSMKLEVFWKDKTDKHLTLVNKKKYSNKIKNERRDFTTDTKQVQKNHKRLLWIIIHQ